MKPKSRIKELGILAVLFLGIFFSSCIKEETLVVPESDLSSNLALKCASVPNMTCDLIAGQNTNVGEVIYSYDSDAGQLFVTYKTTGNWMITEVHLFVGTQAKFITNCTNKKAIQIGHFPYSASNLKTVKYDFNPITIDAKLYPEGLTIVAHAIVKNGKQEETAFSNCSSFKPLITVKSKFSNGAFAETEGDPFSTDPDQWCFYLGTNTYEGNDEYLFQSQWYPNAILGYTGKVVVNDDGETLSITVQSNNGLKLSHTYLYVGTLQGLQSYAPVGGCPNYPIFPFQNSTTATTHSFSVPMPNVSFEKAFGSNRWGWINHFYF